MKTKKARPDPVKRVDLYPFLVEKKYAQPLYYRSWKAAQDRLRSDVEGIRDGFELLMVEDSLEACDEVLAQINRLPPERTATVSGVIDPFTGHKYTATIVKREAI